MSKSRVFFIILAIVFSVYWFVLFPLLWVYLKPVIVDGDGDSKFWTTSIFWCSALLIFVLLILTLWFCVYCLRKRDSKALADGNEHLDSFTIHNADNKNIKDRVQMHEVKLRCRSDADTYKDINDVFVRPKYNTTTQTSQTSDNITSTSIPSSVNDFDILRSTNRMNSYHSCNKSIEDDDMVNIFLNRLWTIDNETNGVKFEVVGKSVNQAKRIQINEIDDNSTSTIQTHEITSDADDAPVISIPVRHSSRLKSEIFIMINDDSTVQAVNGSDDVFK